MKQHRRNLSLVVFFSLWVSLFASAIAAAEPSKASESKALAEELGSLRNARVAIKMPDSKIQLTYLALRQMCMIDTR